jgi:glycosyltransferase involved in cell wall biosynthesis
MLRDGGHEVTIFIYDLSVSNVKVTIENGIRVVRFLPEKTKAGYFMGFNAALSYEYAHIVKTFIAKEGKPFLLESQEYLGIAYYIQQFKLLGYEQFKDLSILITCHSPSFICLEYNHVPVYQFPNYWIGQMEKASIRSADILVSPSVYFINEAKQRMSWHGIHEINLVNPLKAEIKNDPSIFEANYLVYFGKLAPLKGTFELLSYFKELWDEGFQHPLHIIGGTQQIFHPERLTMGDWLKKKYDKYLQKGLLVLHGEYDAKTAKEKLSKAHVIIVPSLFDNLPYTVLEAMALGKVVLASVQGGQSEVIIDGLNGFLFDHHKQGDFKNKLSHILNLGQSEIASLGQRAIETIQENYSYNAVYRKKKKIIEEYNNSKEELKQFPFLQQSEESPEEIKIANSKNGMLSIVIPFYNMGDYIEECVRSIIKSDYSEKEIIIVDDGSTDRESINKLNNIKEKYPVKIYHKTNEGLPVARNTGAEQANGQFLTFLDADDTINETYYQKAINVLKQYDNVHFVGCWTKYFGESNDVWPTFNPDPPYLLVHNMVNSSSLVYKRSSFLSAGANDKSFIYGMEDWDSVINMIKYNYKGVVLPEILFNYRVRKNSMARNFTKAKLLYLHLLISRKHSTLYRKHASDIINLLQANGSGLNFDNPTLDLPGEFYIPLLSRRIQEKIKQKIKRNKSLKNTAYYIYKKLKK